MRMMEGLLTLLLNIQDLRSKKLNNYNLVLEFYNHLFKCILIKNSRHKYL